MTIEKMQQANDLLVEIGRLKLLKEGTLQWSVPGIVEAVGKDVYNETQQLIRDHIQPMIDNLQEQFDGL